MSLKCPICGREYSHDRKICQACEDKSIYSGVIIRDKIGAQKWNCAIFLEFNTFSFGKRKITERHIKITSEPKFSDFKAKKEYKWNCNLSRRLRTHYNLKSDNTQLRDDRILPDSYSRILRKGVNNSLIYE